METGIKKDFWDKLKIGGFVAIPIVVLIIGSFANSSLKKKDIEVRMIELAVGILKEDPKAKDNPETPPMRKWAIDIINEYSKVKLSDEVRKELEENPFPETVSWALPFDEILTATATLQLKDPESTYVFYGIEIQSQPLGASIYVDGKFDGKTNKVILMSAGEHEVKLKLNNEERIVRINPLVTNTVKFNFDR